MVWLVKYCLILARFIIIARDRIVYHIPTNDIPTYLLVILCRHNRDTYGLSLYESAFKGVTSAAFDLRAY